MKPIRFSNLRWMAKSPAHYNYALTHPPDETKAMRFGSALDALLFKTKQVLVFEGKSRNSKAWDTFAAERPEAVLLTTPQQEIVLGMLASVQANSQAMDLLNGGKQQQRIAWKIGDRDCAGTPDVWAPSRVVELKSTRNANPDWFQYDARKMGYHVQLAWYTFALQTLGLVKAGAENWIVAVESSPPHPVTIFQLTERAQQEGAKLWRLWFERLLVCEQADSWPGYTAATVPLDTPDTDSLTLKVEGEDLEVE